MAVSTKYVGSRWQMSSNTALKPSPCTSHRSQTAGTAAQYVPRNGTAPRMAARASGREGRMTLMSEKRREAVAGASHSDDTFLL